jgi:hypothetical protein
MSRMVLFDNYRQLSTVSSIRLQLCREEVSRPAFGPHRRKFSRYFKGLFINGMGQFESCKVSQTFPFRIIFFS